MSKLTLCFSFPPSPPSLGRLHALSGWRRVSRRLRQQGDVALRPLLRLLDRDGPDECSSLRVRCGPLNGKPHTVYEPHSTGKLIQVTFLPLAVGLAMLDGFVYAVGGWEGNFRLHSVERYDPHTNCWQFTESFKMAVTSPAVVALDGLLYVTGRHAILQYATTRCYKTCTVSLTGHLKKKKKISPFVGKCCFYSFISYFLLGGAVLEDGDGTHLAQVYNPKTCVWTELAPMQIARSGSAACTLKGKLYVIGAYIRHTNAFVTNKDKTLQFTLSLTVTRRWVARLDGKHG